MAAAGEEPLALASRSRSGPQPAGKTASAAPVKSTSSRPKVAAKRSPCEKKGSGASSLSAKSGGTRPSAHDIGSSLPLSASVVDRPAVLPPAHWHVSEMDGGAAALEVRDEEPAPRKASRLLSARPSSVDTESKEEEQRAPSKRSVPQAEVSSKPEVPAPSEVADRVPLSTHKEPARKNTLTQTAVSPLDVLCIMLLCLVPSALTVVGFSVPFYGVMVFNAFAQRHLKSLAVVATAFAFLWLVALFIFDVQRWHRGFRILAFFATYAMVWTIALLRCLTHPWAVVMATLCMTPVLLLLWRSVRMTVRRSAFYWTAAAFMFFSAAVLTTHWSGWALSSMGSMEVEGPWTTAAREKLIEDTAPLYKNAYSGRPLSYEDDCSENMTMADRGEQTAIDTACRRVEAVQLVIWSAPLAGVVFNVAVAVFLLSQGRHHLTDARDISGILRQFLAVMTFLMFVLGFALWYMTGIMPLLAQAYIAFCVLAIVGLGMFMWCEVREELLSDWAHENVMVKYCVKFLHSELFKAMAVLVWFTMVPALLVLDWVRHRVRRLKGHTEATASGFTPLGEYVVSTMKAWNWNSIFSTVCLLGILFVVLLLGGKATFVTFSWLNDVLSDFDAVVVGAVVFVIGVVMFMLPPVPGSAVYVFAGIVCGRRLLLSTGNIWLASAVSSAIALVAKLVGCCGQYAIGFWLGKSVRIQKLVGVDTVPTRAIEKIIKERGLGLGKVAILVGGPDWPTSVTCGILRLNIPQMLLGTLPVFPVSVFPQTFVGALLVREAGDGDDPAFWSTLSTACTSFAALAQAAASLIAAYKITQTIERDHDELSLPRPEHRQVAELTAREAQLVQAFKVVSEWRGPHMTLRRKGMIVTAAFSMLIVGFVFAMDFVFSEPLCFRTFAITDRIEDPLQDGGLSGDPRNIVVRPVGAMNLYLFAGAALLFQVHSKELGRAARRYMNVDME